MKNSLPRNLYSFIWYFLRPYKVIVVVFSCLAIFSGFYKTFNSILLKNIIDILPQAQGEDISAVLLPVSFIVMNFILFNNFTWKGIIYIRCKYGPVIINHIIEKLMDYIFEKSQQFFQDNLSGTISKQIINLAECIEKITTRSVPYLLRVASLLLTAFISTYFVNPIFSLILIIWFIFFAGVVIIMSKKLVYLSDKQALAESIVIGELVDAVSNQSNIRIFSRKSYEKLRFVPFLNKQKKAYRDTYFYALIMNFIQGGLIAIMMALSSYFLVYLYSKNLVTIGDFALIIILSMETGHMTWFTMSEVDEFNRLVGKCKQSLAALMAPIEIQDKPDAKPLECNKGQIRFDNVKFHYKGTKTLFQNKSINIKAGQKVGLVGYSGCGKSTFVNLILRLYDVTEGNIFIDNQNIEKVTQDSLHQNISMIPQDPSLFNRSLMDNIRYGRIDSTDEEVILAAKKAHAHEFIIQLPQGYDSLVGERGIKLSGGQRQRVAIARAILKNAPLLILDEATSQLDSVTEAMIQERFWELMQGKTTIVIAHRLSTLLHMDRILVFDKGRIIGDGIHKNLLKDCKLYKKLWNTQIGGFLG